MENKGENISKRNKSRSRSRSKNKKRNSKYNKGNEITQKQIHTKKHNRSFDSYSSPSHSISSNHSPRKRDKKVAKHRKSKRR